MSIVNMILRGLIVLMVMLGCVVAVWQFTLDTDYFYYSIGAAVLIICGVILLVYGRLIFNRSPQSQNKGQTEVEIDRSVQDTEVNPESDTIEIETDYTDTPSILRAKSNQPFRVPDTKPADSVIEDSLTKSKFGGQTSLSDGAAVKNDNSTKIVSEDNNSSPAIPLVEDQTVLSDEEKNLLLNAVWYRCENPYCKYTNFLGVHHIVEEKEGGTNRLDNLIVLCPYCHDLAHRQEIPEEEMREWIGNRETRFKFKPEWKYF